MSRVHFDTESYEKHSVIDNHVFLTEALHAPVTAKEVALYTNRDSASSNVTNYINYGWPKKIEEQLKPYFRRKSELNFENSCILWSGRVIIPMQLQIKVLTEIHDNHHGIVKNEIFSLFISMVTFHG